MFRKIKLLLVGFVALSAGAHSFGMNEFRRMLCITEIYDAICNNNIDKVRELIKDKKFDVNKADKFDNIPLCLACKKGFLEIVQELLKIDGINVNIVNREGDTALYIACKSIRPNFKEVLKELLKRADIDINKANDRGETQLYLACCSNRLTVAKLLLENGADVNKPDSKENHWTPLYRACWLGYLDMLKLLLVWGANIDKTALNFAKNKPTILRFLNFTKEFDKYCKISNNVSCWLKFDDYYNADNECWLLKKEEREKTCCEKVRMEISEFEKELQNSKRAKKQSIFKELGMQERLINSSDCRIITVS